MTNTDHENTAAVELAAMWLADQNPQPRPAVPALRARFNLTPTEACEAIAFARRFRMNREAFG